MPGWYELLRNGNIPKADGPPTNQTYSYRAWLHQICFTYKRMHIALPPSNWTYSYRAWLHHIHFTYRRMHIYPGLTYPPTNWTYSYRAWLHHIHFTYRRMNAHMPRADIPPPLIEPTATEPDYTTYISHIEECTYAQGWHTPLLIKPTTTQPNYTKYIEHIEECT